MARRPTGWEATRLSKHFILLDFLADHAVYRSCKPLVFDDDKVWNDEHETLARGLCKYLLEPLIAAYGPISVADAFWPSVLDKGHYKGSGPKHRWTGGEATVDIALYELVDKVKTERALKKAVDNFSIIDGCRDRVLSYPNTEFLCVTFKSEGARKCGKHDCKKKQSLRAHHVRVGKYFNFLDFCRNGRAVEKGIDLVPKELDSETRDYQPIAEETVARSFAAALDPLVERLGRVSVVRGMETAQLSSDEDDNHTTLHRWDQSGPWRLVCVLPQDADPDMARDILNSSPHVQDAKTRPHASESCALEVIVEQKPYDVYHGMRPIYAP